MEPRAGPILSVPMTSSCGTQTLSTVEILGGTTVDREAAMEKWQLNKKDNLLESGM
jgi:hypothetical protein